MATPQQIDEMTEMTRMGWVSHSIVTPDLLATVLTADGKAALVQLFLVWQHCGFAFTTSKQQCLRILFDAPIDKGWLTVCERVMSAPVASGCQKSHHWTRKTRISHNWVPLRRSGN
jgi:hypothetical protein